MEIAATVPIKPHLKRFLYYKIHSPLTDPVPISANNPFLYMLTVLLTGKNKVNLGPRQKVGPAYSDRLQIIINTARFDRGEIFLSAEAIIKYNRFLYGAMIDDLFAFIVAKKSHGVPMKTAVMDYMAILQIHDFTTMDALIKAVKRMRDQKQIDNKTIKRLASAVAAL